MRRHVPGLHRLSPAAGHRCCHAQGASVVTQIEVDPEDPAFQNPTKPIGAFLTKEQADAEKAAHPDMQFVEDSGRGYRRVVASPQPKKIVEYESILNLLDNEFIVIACGGGGIPVIRDYSDKGTYKGVAAVIDKDMGGELLAEDCHADTLVLLTAVDHVAINFGKPNQEDLVDVSVEEARRYVEEGQFGKGSMEPKVMAGIKFAESRPGPGPSPIRQTRERKLNQACDALPSQAFCFASCAAGIGYI